jgi:hypothetical protein
VVTNSRVFYTTREAAGATGTRRFLRPLLSEGKSLLNNSGASRREIERARVWLFENLTMKGVNRVVYDITSTAAARRVSLGPAHGSHLAAASASAEELVVAIGFES